MTMRVRGHRYERQTDFPPPDEAIAILSAGTPGGGDMSADVILLPRSERGVPGPAPCGCADAKAVMWNRWNRVVQCHGCGVVYEPVRSPAQAEAATQHAAGHDAVHEDRETLAGAVED